MNKNTKNQFSIIIPVYNEESTIEQTLTDLLEGYRDSEIIVIDDGSSDGTRYKLEKFNVKIIRHGNNKGYGAALKTGIRNARKNFIVTIDADREHSAKYIDSLVADAKLSDMVVGARIKDDALIFPLHQRIAKGFICLLLGLIFKQRILDINSGLRLMRKSVVEKYLSILPDGFSFTASITLAMLLGNHKIEYVPISYSKRIGKSKVKVFNYALNFIKNYWRIIYQLKFINRLN